MSQPSCPATPRELLTVLREFAAGQETTAGLNVDPAECATDLVALAESLAVLTSALAAAMVRYDRLDAGSPAALLVQNGHLTRTEADNLRTLGRQLEADLPVTRAKLAAGQVGVAQAKTIAALDKQLAKSPAQVPAEARRQIEAVLAEDAVAATTTETARAASTARYRIDPETVEQEMRAQRDQRGITLAPTLDDTRHVTGLLDPASAAIWDGFFDRTAAPASADDLRTAAARRVDAITDAMQLLHRITPTPDHHDDHRNHDDRGDRGDLALQESCNTQPTPRTPADLRSQESCKPHPTGRPFQRPATAQTGEDPATGNQPGGFAWRKTSPAQLMVIATHDLLTGKPGAEPATLGDGTVIPAETARRYLCEAALNRVILPTEDQPLQLGRTTRLFTPMQVKAMIVRDRTCRWKGCDVPANRCTPHHALPWSHGGTTDTNNGLMLCPTHHRMTHEDHPPGPAAGAGEPPEPNLRAA